MSQIYYRTVLKYLPYAVWIKEKTENEAPFSVASPVVVMYLA